MYFVKSMLIKALKKISELTYGFLCGQTPWCNQ